MRIPRLLARGFIAVTFLLLAFAPAFAGSAAPVQVGSKITVKKAVDIDKLAKDPEKFVGQTVRLEGRVKAVCQGLGCWVEVENRKGTSFLAKSLDESIRLPKDCVGRTVVVEGVVTKLLPKPPTEEELAQEGHACPQPTYLVATKGAMLP
jgi:hypothetical protein